MAKSNLVDAYLAKQPEEAQRVLQRVRRLIRKQLPDAEETISYGIPAYKRQGQYVVYFAGWKRHWSLYPVTDTARAALGSKLDAYELRKGTVRFPLDEPVPVALVQRIVVELAKAAQARRRVSTRSAGSSTAVRRRRA